MITGNPGKAEELKHLLNIDQMTIDYQDLSLVEVQSLDIEAIGYKKTQSAFQYSDVINSYDAILTDDTALTCEALNGLPGPLIKWFLKSIKTEGILDLLKGKDRKTVATCLLSLGMIKDHFIYQFRGDIDGELVEARGKSGFGWDKIFLPTGYQFTYGEMDSVTKNEISHRALAVQNFRQWLIS